MPRSMVSGMGFWIPLVALHGPGSGYGLGAAFTALALVVMRQSHNCSVCVWLGPPRDDRSVRIPGADFSAVRSSSCDDTAVGNGLHPAPCERSRFSHTDLNQHFCCAKRRDHSPADSSRARQTPTFPSLIGTINPKSESEKLRSFIRT